MNNIVVIFMGSIALVGMFVIIVDMFTNKGDFYYDDTIDQ
jgi:hypothetical protein